MKKIFFDRVGDARKLASFALVCLAIIMWISARACFALFNEVILSSLQEWLLSRNQHREAQQAQFNYRVTAKREGSATAP